MEDQRCKRTTTHEGSPSPMFDIIAYNGTADGWPEGDEEKKEGWALNWDTAALAGLRHPRLSISY